MTAYDIVLKSRAKGRPTAAKYIEKITENFIELHGDRRFADDAAVSRHRHRSRQAGNGHRL